MSRSSLPIALAILLLSTFGAQAQDTTGEPAPASAVQKEQEAPAKTEEKAAAKPGAESESEDSPFDYRASEQISEDLSVSFPVDI